VKPRPLDVDFLLVISCWSGSRPRSSLILPFPHDQAYDAIALWAPGGGRLANRFTESWLARIFHELLSRDHEDGCATGQPQGVGSEAYLNGTSQGPTPEDARKDGHVRGRSK
jgi:hypothetical protein